MHRSRHLTLTSSLWGVNARGDRCPGYSLGERRRLERRRHGGAQQLLVPETTDACEVSRQAPRPDSSGRPLAHRNSEQRAHRRRTIHGTKTARPAGIRVDTG